MTPTEQAVIDAARVALKSHDAIGFLRDEAHARIVFAADMEELRGKLRRLDAAEAQRAAEPEWVSPLVKVADALREKERLEHEARDAFLAAYAQRAAVAPDAGDTLEGE